ncbi:hypothetical protein BC834DRAFT_667569 [Gloeopeniophorella convolvens]|nr:hypothetical protein BC834DRAFT_667569 [Gloeopeniophorella convolvens]
MSNLPPLSTRLPGAPPPPVLPPAPYGGSKDSNHARTPVLRDEKALPEPENDRARAPPADKHRARSPSPVGTPRDELPPRPPPTQEGRREQMQPQSYDRAARVPAGDRPRPDGSGAKSSPEARRAPLPADERQPAPASWDRPRDAPLPPPPQQKTVTLPPGLPAKPVAALADLALPPPRGMHQSRGRRPPRNDDGGGRWDGTGDRDRDREKDRNKWGPEPETRGRSLLARITPSEPFDELDVDGGETRRKKVRARRY